MFIIEILIFVSLGYLVLLLLLEGFVGKLQPDMEGGVTLHFRMNGDTRERKLFGLRYDGHLYVASNHWFRRWYKAILKNPEIEVELDGKRLPCTAVMLNGAELDDVAEAYAQGFFLKFMCGFARQRFLRLDLKQPSDTP